MANQKSTILVIDDDDTIRDNISDLLSWDDYYVITAKNGQQGLRLALEIRPHLILCDIMMPDMDGYEVLQNLRSSPTISTTPFIFLTALSDREHVRRGMKIGADDYLSKPFSASELLATVHARLQRLEDIQAEYEQELEMARKSFTQMVAHELRTPLISIVMVQEMIAKRAEQLTPLQIQELMTTMESGTRRLRHLVEQVVFMNQLETRLLNEQIIQDNGILINLKHLLKESVNTAQLFVYRNKPNHVNLSLPENDYHLRGDFAALKQALAEIISNAINFSPPSEPVDVMVEEKKSNWISITVRDFGVGIPRDKIALAQMEFQQINREKQEQQGLGLGLPLAQRIVSVHKGELQIKSVEEQGTEVMIILPLTTP